MHNWSVDEVYLKQYPEQSERFELEQLINYGLGKAKLSRRVLKRLLPALEIDPHKRRYLEFLTAS